MQTKPLGYLGLLVAAIAGLSNRDDAGDWRKRIVVGAEICSITDQIECHCHRIGKGESKVFQALENNGATFNLEKVPVDHVTVVIPEGRTMYLSGNLTDCRFLISQLTKFKSKGRETPQKGRHE